MESYLKAARARSRPYLSLQDSPAYPLRVLGVLETWRHLETPARRPWLWFERSLPVGYRMAFSAVPGLDAFAVSSSADVPAEERSPEWARLLRWKSRYAALGLHEKTVLLKLLGMLSLYRDNETLLAGDPPLPSGPWSEADAEYAFVRVFNKYMIHEPEAGRGFEDMLGVAEASPARGATRVVAALRYMIWKMEREILGADVRRAERLAAAAVKRLDGLGDAARALHASKYWRTRCFMPFLTREFEAMRRELGKAEDFARAALRSARGGELALARENLYAVLATWVVAENRSGRPERARAWAEELAAFDPLCAWPRLSLGMIAVEAGRWPEACAHLRGCLDLGPSLDREACAWMSRALKGWGRIAEAAEWERTRERLQDAFRRRACAPGSST